MPKRKVITCDLCGSDDMGDYALNTLEHIFSGMMKRRKLNEFRAKT